MKAKVNLHFYAKSTKANAKGQFPIYVRLTVNGIRTEFSTKKFIEPSRWLSEASKVKGTTEEARSINSYLDLIKSKVLDIKVPLINPVSLTALVILVLLRILFRIPELLIL